MDDGRLRNKEGHPIYSREDIREQYCINSKELGVFEDDYFQEQRLFGCLSTHHLPDKSPCNRSNSLLSCVRKSSVEDNGEKQAIETPQVDKDRDEEEEDSDGGFKRRQKPRTFLISEYRNVWAKTEANVHEEVDDRSLSLVHPSGYGNVSRFVAQKAPLQTSYSHPPQDISSAVHAYRPCVLHFDASRDGPPLGTTCRSVDELNGRGRAAADWYTPEGKLTEAKDLWDEDGKEKHVSFDSNSIVRSNTIGGGLESNLQLQQFAERDNQLEVVLRRRAISPPVAVSIRGRNHSQERLIKAVVRQAERSISSVRSLDLAALQSTSSVYTTVSQHVHPTAFYTSPSYIPAYRFIRRAIMRTQATQTETDRCLGKHSRLIPAYLTLSPRASSHKKIGRQSRYSGHYYHHHHQKRLETADSSRFMYSDESDDEIMEVHVKEHKPRKSSRSLKPGKERVPDIDRASVKGRTRQRIRAQKSVTDNESFAAKSSEYEPVGTDQDISMYKNAFEKSHSVDELGNYGSNEISEESILVRRHSLAEDYSADKCFTVLYPPPGFGESIDEVRKARNHRGFEDSPAKSSTESSKAIYSGLTDGDQHSITEIDDLDLSLRSHESPTLVSEMSPTGMVKGNGFEKVLSVEGEGKRFSGAETTKVTRRPLVVGPPKIPMAFKSIKSGLLELTSPESETSSHLTEVLSSKSEKTTSSSDHNEVIEEKQSGSGSSIYITATDQSPREYGKDKLDEGQTSFETASSAAASQFSSPSSSGKRKSSSSGAEEQLVSPDIHVMETKSIKQISLLSPARPQYPRSPKKQSRFLFPEEPRSESSEDSSTTKKERTGSPGSESMGSKSIEQLEEFDSEGIGDSTPIHELCSSDPSTAFEPTTVVENIMRIHGVQELLSVDTVVEKLTEQKGDVEPPVMSKEEEKEEEKEELEEEEVHEAIASPPMEAVSEEGEAEPVESDDLEAYGSEEREFTLSGTSVFCRRTLSGELSTVSEVSEEMSNQKSDFSGSSSASIEKIEKVEDVEVSRKGEGKPEENGSPSSSRSTTSGSFVIDCHSEMHSPSEDIKEHRTAVKKTESLPCLRTDEESFKEADVKSGTSESLSPSVAPQEETTSEKVSEKVKEGEEKEKVDTTGESSQATERDIARSEFSLEQQSSQEIDEESLSMGAYCVSYPPHEQSLLADNEDTSSTTTPTNQQWRWKQPEPAKLRGHQVKKRVELVAEQEVKPEKDKAQEKVVEKPASDSQTESGAKIQEFCHLHEATTSTKSSEEPDAKDVPCTHKFTCSHCGQLVHETYTGALKKSKDPELPLKSGLPIVHRKSATLEEIVTEKQDDEQDIGVHVEAYRSAFWFYIGPKDELVVWGHRLLPTSSSALEAKEQELCELTDLERSFRKQYDAVTHRMIHRKASIEMYRKILENQFRIEKTVNVIRSKGEFGFRIHGSRPVVVSAIEKGTPAESCGLEIGDIVVSVNDINVMEASHSDVVRLAHSGSDCLKLELVPTFHILRENEQFVDENVAIISGYLEKCTGTAFDSCDAVWRRRWFVLKVNLYLCWYKTSSETELLGAFCLQSCCASLIPGKHNETSNVFKISKYSESPHFFTAVDEQMAIKWVEALNDVSNKLSQADPFMETTLRNIHVAADMVTNVDACGFLEKFNQRRKMWKQRYFVLKDACLYFYAEKSSTTALGIFYLHGYKVQSCTMIAMKNTFEAIPPESRFRHLWLKAESELDKKRWLAALEYSIDRWLKLK